MHCATNSAPLWQPSNQRINESNMMAFARQVQSELGLSFTNYDELQQWSITEPEQFWRQVWQFTDIRATQPWQPVLDQATQFPGAKWFTGAKLNFAENLLRNRSDKTALICRLENGSRTTLS